MDLMTSRFKSLGFGTRRKNSSAAQSQNQASTQPNNNNYLVQTSNGASSNSPPPGHSSSTTSLPMNNQNPPGRPPSYTYNAAGRPTSPMPPGQQLIPHPAPSINPTLQFAAPSLTPGPPPPVYGYPHSIPQSIPQSVNPHPGLRNPAVEVEGAGRSKAQLIVGIDFGTTFSGVAFAFATNNEAREDIITEWPGAGNHTKQKVRTSI